MKIRKLRQLLDEITASPDFNEHSDVDILHITYTDEGEPDTLNYMDFQYLGVAGDRLVVCNVDEDDLSDALEAEEAEDVEEDEELHIRDLPFGTKGDDSEDEDATGNSRQQEL